MKIKKILNIVLIIAILFSTIKLNVQATNLPYVTNTETEPLDHSIKLSIRYRYGNPTSYMIQRSETREGDYITIADNIIGTTYTDTGLENSKAYYYKIYARNNEGLGIKPDLVEGIASAPKYVWFDIYGLYASINGIDIYDSEGIKLNYTGRYVTDETNSTKYGYDYYDYKLLNHTGQRFNQREWKYNRAPKTRLALELPTNMGIGKISVYAGNGAPIKTDIFISAESSLSGNAVAYAEINFERRGAIKEYAVYESGLTSKSYDKEIKVEWNHNDEISEYSIMRSESEQSGFDILADKIITDSYVDNTVDNNKEYYYKVVGNRSDGMTANLGIVHNTPSKDKYLIIEFYESYYKDRMYINELQVLDSNNTSIPYGVAEAGAFRFVSYHNMQSNIIDALCRNYNIFRYSQDNDVNNYADIPHFYFSEGHWVRYALVLHDNIGVDKVNFWAGTDKQPKQVTIYTASDYSYDGNLMQRKNDNISFFDQQSIADSDQVIKYEFTQSAPDTPQGINGVSKDTRAKLIWNKVDNADNYKIKRSTAPGGPYTTIAEDVLETEYIDTVITNGTEYYYVVSAVNDGGESTNSAEISVMPNPQLPQAPMKLQVTPSDNAIELTWQSVYNADNYKVMRSETEGGPYVSVLESTTANTFVDMNVVFGTTYYYIVQARNTTGISNNSEEVQGVPGQVLPSTPSNIITKVREKNVYITWDAANDATSYSVMRSNIEDGTYTVIQDNIRGISYRDSDVEYDDTHYYKIVAVNEKGQSEPSGSIRVNVMDTTEQKILLSLTMTNGTTKDYLFTQTQLADFMNWYQSKVEKQGLPYFTVMAKNKYGAYKAHKSYILFDSILSIDIKEIQDK